MSTPVRLLNDGHSIPVMGFGLWQVPAADTANNVRTAIDLGYRLVDCASVYGNEAEMGEGVRTALVSRDEMFIATKVWNADQGYDRARRAIESSLQRIGLETLDLCLIHWPCPSRHLYLETWKALIAARNDGQVRSIGVSNFNVDHLDRIVGETAVMPALNQIEINPRLQQRQLQADNALRGVATQSWSPLGLGNSFESPAIQEICERTGRSAAQIILRWHIEQDILVIPRATKRHHLLANLATLEFELTAADLASIGELEEGMRCGPDPLIFE